MTDVISKSFNSRTVVQIGIVVKDVEKATKACAHLFGIKKPECVLAEPEKKSKIRYNGQKTKARAKLAFVEFENITVELIEPIDGPSTWMEFLEENGPGVHHIAFNVQGMDDQIDLLEGKGARLIQEGQWTTGRGGRYAYLDSFSQLGIILELLEEFGC